MVPLADVVFTQNDSSCPGVALNDTLPSFFTKFTLIGFIVDDKCVVVDFPAVDLYAAELHSCIGISVDMGRHTAPDFVGHACHGLEPFGLPLGDDEPPAIGLVDIEVIV
jgi:hypothetical protein